MNRVYGSKGAAAIVCVNPKKNKWRVRWDFRTEEDGSYTYMEESFDHQPSAEEIETLVTTWYNAETTKKIVTGFRWEGHQVWLTNENQLNYKVAHDLAVQTNGKNLPVVFKFDYNYYHQFSTVEELQKFYVAYTCYVQKTLQEGWTKKDGVDFNVYNLN